ncbi:hypothetical protein CGLO_12530 [Colletotrichum gloeosporioides Cg-14]|uniref:Uncharacterized protein n=1 Tax=Colletotrichum gloeosporioides (strain Cg-14) TaxID=1237896 RepID=T0LJC3_COLGC|nr:hypothetical protein CGLO_12530 [Colletotrichum gloeosporioides Cg-14]
MFLCSVFCIEIVYHSRTF